MDPSASAPLFTSYVLKDGDSFLIADGHGDIVEGSAGQYHNDTRVLSRFVLRLGGTPLVLLSATVTRDNVYFVSHLTNRQLPPLGGEPTGHGLLHVARTRFLHDDRMYERIVLVNYGSDAIEAALCFELDADFRDMFEVRGTVRPARGERLPVEAVEHGLQFGYRGLDDVVRRSELRCSRGPLQTAPGVLEIPLALPAGGRTELYLEAGIRPGPLPSRPRYRAAAARALRRMRTRRRRSAGVRSSGPMFQAWMERSRADLALLTSELATGPYPYAGIPWFSTPFGRDAVVTALQTLWLDPGLARGVLCFLARHQAQEESAFLDASPGKIMHETRKGEMSALRELPFGLYYGGVDTTPLFVMLAAAYADRSGDAAFIDELWPALLQATGWIERVCDANPLGLLDYARGESSGLANQGWKDSADSVFHADGRLPSGPVALVEVQGYAFAAFRAMAALATRRGEPRAAEHWRARADTLRETVEQRFWIDQRAYYGIAVDGEGALCEVRASNPGHLLYVGLPDPARARRVSAQLMSPAFHSGWGLRTLAEGEPRFNPMSYHNGSVWPHDSALCAAGIARYGGRDEIVRLLRTMFETAVHFELRLPELFCGFAREPGAAPVPYPVACLPQAWAAGSGLMLLQACLGVSIDGWQNAVRVDHPALPPGVDEVSLHGLAVGEYRITLVFKRFGGRVGVFAEGPDAARVAVSLRS